MISFIYSTMMSPLTFTILVIFGVVTSQNRDVNSKIPYGGTPPQSSVESRTLIPSDRTVKDEGIRLQPIHLETLCTEKLDYLITDSNKRFQTLENQSSEVIRLLVEKLDNLTTEVGRISQCCSVPTNPAIQNNEILEGKVENLSKDIRALMEATKKLKYPRNCGEVGEFKKTASGYYMIQPEHASKPFEAVCELETRRGGWTVIQRRFNGSQDFYLGWEDYKTGFGNLGGEFWLGLENIHLLTGFEVNELLIEIGDFDSHNGSAFYSEFNVGSEIEGYSLKVLGDYSGNAGDDLTYSAGMKFSTNDNDQDVSTTYQCAQTYGGAWWYKNCLYCNLNGKYVSKLHYEAMYWLKFKNQAKLKHTRMLVRPKV